MKKNVSLIVFLLQINLSLAQSGDNAPVVYDQFFNNYFLLNPGVSDANIKAHVQLGHRSLTGLFKGVNRFYADAGLLLKSKKEHRFHSVGILAMNNQDGDFINRSRLYVRYAWYTQLGKRSSLSAGAAVGFVNYSFKATPASGGGSSFSPDANAGIWYIRENFKAGISFQQFTKPILKPVNQVFILESYFNFNLIKNFYLSNRLNLQNHLYIRSQFDLYSFEIAPILVLDETLQGGINYRHGRGVAIFAGINNLQIGTYKLRFMASYLISTRQLSSMNDGVLEFSFGCFLPE